ncbi:TolC family protein [Saccharicrinis sp. FJH54]|uniref:TolC family protein n=1 Tax=Saccharicrinis sp. FJH54 TaxID=3344665 RepID=UPI0035D506E3
MKRILFILTAVILCASGLKAQKPEVHLLDLETSIAIAKMSSYDILILRQNIKMAEFNLKATTSSLKTHVDMDMQVPGFSNTIYEFRDPTGVVSYNPLKTNALSGRLRVTQPLPTDGNIFLEANPSVITDYTNDTRTSRFNTAVRLNQPLNAFFGYNDIQTNFKTAKLNYESSQKRLTREELNLVYNVSNNFYNLLAIQKRMDIAKLNLDRQKEAYDIAQNKFAVGLIREVDALQMEVDLAEAQNNYDLNRVNLETASNSFKELLGLPITDSITIDANMDYAPVIVELDKALEYARKSRLELREQDIQIELNELNLKRQKAQGRISGAINASYGLTGIDDEDNPGAFNLNQTTDRVITNLTDRGPNYGVSLDISIPIIDWGENKARVNRAKAQLQQNIYQKEQLERSIDNEVRNLVANYSNSLKRLQLLEKNVAVAEKSFKITLSRYSDGDIDSQALALERERLNNAYLSHLSAYINYELLLADLMRKTYYDFKEDRPIN